MHHGKSCESSRSAGNRAGKTRRCAGNHAGLGYEASDKVGREPILISGLVAINMTGLMNDALAQLMNRPDARTCTGH